MRQQKGFTLIEMLIVIVIIAVLASLTVPRFLQQPEKAVIAEANQMLGAIIRAQNNYIDAGYGTTWVVVNATTNSGNWIRLGMQAPGTTNFTYSCSNVMSTTYVCSAVRSAAGGAYAGSEIYNLSNGSPWNCTSGIGARHYESSSTGGCTIGA